MYDAFLSYSHAADGRLAPALQQALHRFAKPLWRTRAMRVFRDKSTLALTPELWPAVRGALRSSRWFILLASPDAAASRWVNDEVAEWLECHSGPSNILIVLTGGDLAWAGSDYDWSITNALPPVLRGKFANEPLYVDLRDKRDEGLSLRHPQFLEDVATIAAAVREVPRDALIGDDIQAHRLLRLLTVSGVTVITVLFLLAAAAAWIAHDERQTSDARRELTEASLLGAEASRMQDDWARLTRVSLEGAIRGATHLGQRGDPFPLERNERLREVVRRLPSSVRELAMPFEVTGLVYSRDGGGLLVAGNGARLLRSGRLGPNVDPDALQSSSMAGMMAADLSVIGGMQYPERVLRFWSTATGRELPRTWEADAQDGMLSPTGNLLATMDKKHLVTVREIATGKVRLRRQLASYEDLKIVFSDDDKRALLASASAPLLEDLVTGREQVVEKAPGQFESAAFSGDGSAIAFITSCRVFVFDAASFAQRMMKETEDCEDVDWENLMVRLADDGSRVTVVRDHNSPSTYSVPSGEVLWPRNVTGIWTIDTTYQDVTADASAVLRAQNGAVTMFSTEDGEILARAALTHEPTALAIDPAQRQIALAYGRRLLILQSQGGDELSESADVAAVRHLSRSYDGRRLIQATDRDVTVWSAAQGRVYRAAGATKQVWMSADGRAAAWSDGRDVQFLRIGEHGETSLLPRFVPSRPLSMLELTDDGSYAVITGQGFALIRDLDTGRDVFEQSAPGIGIGVDPSSCVIALASDREQGTVRLMPLRGVGPTETVRLPARLHNVTPAAAFSTAGRYLLITVSAKEMLTYDRTARSFVRLPPEAMSDDYNTQFLGGDRYLLVRRKDNGSGSNKTTPAAAWDLRTMQRAMSIDIEDAPSAVATDSAATTVAVAGLRQKANAVTLFDLARRQEILRIPSAEKISFLLFSSDGSLLVSAGDRGLLRVWRIDRERGTAAEQARLPHDRSVVYAAFSPDGQTLMSIESDRGDGYRTHLWRWSSDSLLAHARLCLRLFAN